MQEVFLVSSVSQKHRLLKLSNIKQEVVKATYFILSHVGIRASCYTVPCLFIVEAIFQRDMQISNIHTYIHTLLFSSLPIGAFQ
jgi:hypothetical protein